MNEQNNNLNNMFSSTNNMLNTNNQTNIPNPGINNDAMSFIYLLIISATITT